MIDEFIYNQPGHLIRRANQIATAAFMEETAQLAITPVQYAMLVALDGNPGLDATRISEFIAIDRATIGNVVKRLEARGFLVRRSDERDMRVKQIFVTEAGSATIRAVKPLVGRIAERIVGRLDERQREQLVQLLGQLVDIEGSKKRLKIAQAAPPQTEVAA